MLNLNIFQFDGFTDATWIGLSVDFAHVFLEMGENLRCAIIRVIQLKSNQN